MAILEGSVGPLRELALFAGAGGGILGGLLLGWRTVCAVEYDTYAASVLVARQNDGLLEPFPIWDDVRTFDGREWAGRVDVVSGGFPCQDISSAGKGVGISGERSGLWTEMARIVSEVRPRFVFVENSPLLVQRGLAVVLTDFAKLGYDARWGIVSAENAGAPHKRERLWIVADAHKSIVRASRPAKNKAASTGLHKRLSRKEGRLAEWWKIQPEPCSVVYGMAGIVDQLRPIGNGQVPRVAALAWRILTGDETLTFPP